MSTRNPTVNPDVKMLSSIHDVQTQFIDDAEPRVVFDNLLGHLLTLTGSEYGFIGEIVRVPTGRPYLKTRAITNIAWNEETRAFYDQHARSGLDFHNLETLFGVVITSGEAVMSNDPLRDPRARGVPDGHPTLDAFLGLPLYRRQSLIGMIGIANRPDGYDEALVKYLGPFLTTCAGIIHAYSNARRRREAEQALRESEQRYRRLVEDQPEHICRFKPDGELTFVNLAYATFFGKTIEECDGLNLFELIPEPDRSTTRRHLDSLGASRPVARNEHQVIASDGELRWMAWINRALLDESGRPVEFQSIGLDITDRKRSEQERRVLETKMQQVQKLESLGVLAGGIAHDFNNLLTGIMGNASLIRTELAAGSDVWGFADQIEKASHRAADLCRQMLAYSGRGAFLTAPIDLSGLVDEMVDMLKMSVSKKAVLERHENAKRSVIEADATQIRQIVMNLITNASDAIGDRSGTIEISTGSMHCDRSYLAGTYMGEQLPEGEYAFVAVRDSGVGMDVETLGKIFDPFFTTKFTGRGLGLAAVLGIVRGHSGTIELHTEPGRGTTVRVLFPASDRTPRPVEDHPVVEASAAGSGRVLVVDDEDTVRELARSALERSGYEVVVAQDGREALDLFRDEADSISVVLLDMTMPHLSGEEVFTELRQIRSDVRVVFSSGYSAQDVAERLDEIVTAGFIQKPYRSTDLVEAIEVALKDGP